jgi:hypothetical protein
MTTTTESTQSRPAEAIGRIGKHWGWMLAFGMLTIAAGICALVWPGITLLAAAIVFGVQLIVAGIYRLVAAFAAPQESTGTRVMLGVLGVLSLIIGLYAVRHVLLTIVALALLLGIFWGRQRRDRAVHRVLQPGGQRPRLAGGLGDRQHRRRGPAARDPRPVPGGHGLPDRRLADLLQRAADGAGAPAPLCHALGSQRVATHGAM